MICDYVRAKQVARLTSCTAQPRSGPVCATDESVSVTLAISVVIESIARPLVRLVMQGRYLMRRLFPLFCVPFLRICFVKLLIDIPYFV